MSLEKFGREQFEKVAGGVRNAEENVAQSIELTKDLKAEIAKAAAKEDLSPADIIDLAERIQQETGATGAREKSLQKSQERYEKFYGDMQEYAIMEDTLRDRLREAVKEGDYAKIIEAAEQLKRHDTPKDPEGYDAEGTRELYAKFASKFKDISGLVEGKAIVQLDNDKYAFIDHDGNVVSKEYKGAWPYAEGKAIVKLDNGKWAFIDHDGNVVSKEYKDAWSYAEGKAIVQLDNGKYAFIDHDGNVVSKEYKGAWSYAEGKARVQLDNGKYAFIDHDGNIIPFKK